MSRLIHTADREKLRIEDGDDRWYLWKDEEGFISVTTAIKNGLPQWGIIGGGRKQTALGAIIMHDQIHELIGTEPFDPDPKTGKPKGEGGIEAYKMLWRYVDDKWELARENGTEVHDYLEARLTGAAWLPAASNREVAAMQRQVDDFLDTVKPKVYAAEAVVYSREFGYAGTLDAVFEFGSELGLTLPGLCLTDLKTGSAVYSDVALQLGAMAAAEFFGMSDGSEVEVPDFGSAAVLHVRPERWAIRPIEAFGADVLASFLAAVDVAQWGFKYSKKRVGPMILKGSAS